MRKAMWSLDGLFLFQFGGIVAMMLGLSGLCIAVVGLYGALSYVVSRRTKEFGIRAALGALPSDIYRLVSREGATLILVGGIIGCLLSLLVSHLLATFLVGIGRFDIYSYLLAAVVLYACTFPAYYIPARKAMKTDVADCLRRE
jgi:putative ABC transport system permease protein